MSDTNGNTSSTAVTIVLPTLFAIILVILIATYGSIGQPLI